MCSLIIGMSGAAGVLHKLYGTLLLYWMCRWFPGLFGEGIVWGFEGFMGDCGLV